MSTSQLLLNLGLLALVLGLNLGTRTYSSRRVALPLLLAAVAGSVYLRDLPTATTSASSSPVPLRAPRSVSSPHCSSGYRPGATSSYA